MKYKIKKYFINDFIDEIQRLALVEIKDSVEKKMTDVKVELKELQAAGKRNEFQDMFRFYRDLRSFHEFLNTGEYPENTHPATFARFRWLTERLVSKKELNATYLQHFHDT